MSSAAQWLDDRMSGAPERLRERMLSAVAAVSNDLALPDHLAEAASMCMQRALSAQVRREAAMELLAADALFTHACQAAAEAGSETLEAFTAAWNPARFDEMLQAQAK